MNKTAHQVIQGWIDQHGYVVSIQGQISAGFDGFNANELVSLLEEYASQQPSLRWIKAGEGYVPENPETKQWRFSHTLAPVLWRDAKKFAVSENHSDEVEWLSESSPTPKQSQYEKL